MNVIEFVGNRSGAAGAVHDSSRWTSKISVPQIFVAENAAVQTRNSLLRNDAIVGPALTGAQTSGRGGLDAIYWRTFIDIVHDKRGQCLETAAREGHRP